MTAVATISRDELRQKIERGDDFHLFEVLAEPYYRRHHLPGARLMLPAEVQQTVTAAAVPKDADIVLYCWDDH
ncbi:MAG: rhodanese-like domain-containing protein [Gemmatimonadaceae bacterium]